MELFNFFIEIWRMSNFDVHMEQWISTLHTESVTVKESDVWQWTNKKNYISWTINHYIFFSLLFMHWKLFCLFILMLCHGIIIQWNQQSKSKSFM